MQMIGYLILSFGLIALGLIIHSENNRRSLLTPAERRTEDDAARIAGDW